MKTSARIPRGPRPAKPQDPSLTATLYPCEEGGFTAVCNEIKGAVSEGETKEEALSNLMDAIKAILEVSNDRMAEKMKAYIRHSGQGSRPIKSKLGRVSETR
jgi:predicted RNase H-like HicB family nuclease